MAELLHSTPPFEPMSDPHWEHFEHEADIGVRGIGRTRAEAFEQAALALANVVTDADTVATPAGVEVVCEAPDDAVLLVDWLNALVFEMATRGMLFGRFAVEIEDGRLRGEAWGEPIDPGRHDVAIEIKGATYSALEVRRQDDGTWLAQCIVDV